MISPDSPTLDLLENLESVFNLLTIVISLTALLYMRRIFKKTGGFSKQDKAWMWFLASVFSVLLLNLSTQVFIITGGSLAATMEQSSYDVILSFIMTVSRSIMAISMTVLRRGSISWMELISWLMESRASKCSFSIDCESVI